MLMRASAPSLVVSKNTKAMVNQFTRNLFISTGISVCCAVLPATYLFIYVVFQPEIPGVGIFISSIYTWNPLANSLVTMCVIRPYREHLISIVTFKRWKKTNAVDNFTTNLSIGKTERFTNSQTRS
ncbi:hypothetical protein M3Y94_00591300 [Aphelenchoides besseyi]|nr:hypothetical protein M3Y94_00591300 [Aphelenchoides besseyi]